MFSLKLSKIFFLSLLFNYTYLYAQEEKLTIKNIIQRDINQSDLNLQNVPVKIIKREYLDSTSYEVNFEYKEFYVHFEVIGPFTQAGSKKKNLDNFKTINNLYKPYLSPYTGGISDYVKCPKKFLPTIDKILLHEQEVLILTAFANQRQAFGVCSNTMDKLNGSVFGYYHNKTQSNIIFRVFSGSKKVTLEQHKVFVKKLLMAFFNG